MIFDRIAFRCVFSSVPTAKRNKAQTTQPKNPNLFKIKGHEFKNNLHRNMLKFVSSGQLNLQVNLLHDTCSNHSRVIDSGMPRIWPKSGRRFRKRTDPEKPDWNQNGLGVSGPSMLKHCSRTSAWTLRHSWTKHCAASSVGMLQRNLSTYCSTSCAWPLHTRSREDGFGAMNENDPKLCFRITCGPLLNNFWTTSEPAFD